MGCPDCECVSCECAGPEQPPGIAQRVAARYLVGEVGHFGVGDIVLYGKYKNHRGRILNFGKDKWGNPTVEIEPIPKGRKQNKVFGLFKIWRADLKENALAEQAKAEQAKAKQAAAAPKGPPEADAALHAPLRADALAHLLEAGKKAGITIEAENPHKLVVKGPEGMKEKALTQSFERAWSSAVYHVQEGDRDAWSEHLHSHPGDNYQTWLEGRPKSGLGLSNRPKLDFSRFSMRQKGTGKYIHTKWTRLCVCGHPVGVHTADKGADGSRPCIAPDFGIDCDCDKFRPTNKFLSDDEFDRTYKMASAAERVALRFLAGRGRGQVPKDARTVNVGANFSLVYGPAYDDVAPEIEVKLSRVEKLYQSAGLPLRGRCPVLVEKTSNNRSKFFGNGYIQIDPRNVVGEGIGTLIHEVAHWQQYSHVGWHNTAINNQYAEAIKEKRHGEGNAFDKLQRQVSTWEQERNRIQAALVSPQAKRGAVFQHGGYTYKVVRRDDRSVTVSKEKDGVIIKEDLDGEDFNRLILNDYAEAVRHVQTLTKQIDAARPKLVLDREDYGTTQSDWVPTTYSRKNSNEWFAELVTAAVLPGGGLKDHVKHWLHGVWG